MGMSEELVGSSVVDVALAEGRLVPSVEVRRQVFEAVPWVVACRLLSGDLVVKSVREAVDAARVFGGLADSLGAREAEAVVAGVRGEEVVDREAVLVDLRERIAVRKRDAGVG